MVWWTVKLAVAKKVVFNLSDEESHTRDEINKYTSSVFSHCVTHSLKEKQCYRDLLAFFIWMVFIWKKVKFNSNPF